MWNYDFFIIFIRLGFIVYYSNRLPKNEILNKIQEVLFKTFRFLLYLCLFVVPLFGWLALSSLTDSFQLFNQDVPLFSLAQNVDYLGNIHKLLGNLFISLVGLHACAALLHHFILKDNVLKSMLFHRNN
jgi:cytochrome b561